MVPGPKKAAEGAWQLVATCDISSRVARRATTSPEGPRGSLKHGELVAMSEGRGIEFEVTFSQNWCNSG